MEKVNAIGRRKAAVARVYLTEGTGKITIDRRPIDVYFPSSILRYVVLQPLNLLGVADKYDIMAHLDGGGYKGQAEAMRLAISRALVKINPEDKPALRVSFAVGRPPLLREYAGLRVKETPRYAFRPEASAPEAVAFGPVVEKARCTPRPGASAALPGKRA